MSEQPFSWLLAGSIHEMKNSLALMQQELESLLPALESQDARRAALLHYELARVNHGMVQLLQLYKMDQGPVLRVDQVYVPEFLQGLEAEHRLLLRHQGVRLELDCEPELLAFFDERLVASAMNNLINNAIRYTRDRIRLSAVSRDGGLCLQVADNGPGYPDTLLELGNAPDEALPSGSGSTGLGLFFAGKVAALHENGQRNGHTRLFNGEPLGGGVFQLWLP